jgi:hypothetical protein
MDRRLSARLWLVFPAVFLASACGGSEEQSAEQGPSPADASGAEATEDGGVLDAGAEQAVDASMDPFDASKETAGPDAAAESPPEATADVQADTQPEAAADGGPDADAPVPFDAPPEAPADSPSVPAGCVQGSFQPYRGVLHAHTSYSDGEKTPADAFAYARDVAKLDMLVVTDHLEQIHIGTRWADCKKQADAANAPGQFLAACGYEYGSGFLMPLFSSTGHNNVFFNADLFPAVQLDFHDFYKSLAACASCIGQFNHPGDGQDQNWSHFEYFADVDERMNLFEFNSGGPVWDMFFEALGKGWTISPMLNQDNHSANWGTANDGRSGFFMAALDRSSLYDAMLHRRSFMTRDKNASIKMIAATGCWMGSMLSGVASVPVHVEASDPDAADAFTALEVFGPGKQQMLQVDCASKPSCSADLTVQVTQSTFVVARAKQADGQELVSAPIWMRP